MRREKILVVDDDVPFLETIELLLGDAYELTRATEAAEAIELMRSTAFALAIVDQKLPYGVSGVDLSIELRQIRPDLRALILTGYPELDEALKSFRTGSIDYLKKGRDLGTELPMRVAKALAENRNQDSIAALLHKTERHNLEFKSSARWDWREKRANKDLEAVVVRTVSALLNSEGGALLLGVDDHGIPIGLENDYKTLRKADRDGYEAFLMTLLLGVYGNDISPYIRIDFDEIDGHDVCRVAATCAPKPIWIPDGKGEDEHLYVRAGNTTRQLSGREAMEYCKIRW